MKFQTTQKILKVGCQVDFTLISLGLECAVNLVPKNLFKNFWKFMFFWTCLTSKKKSRSPNFLKMLGKLRESFSTEKPYRAGASPRAPLCTPFSYWALADASSKKTKTK